MTRKIQFKRGLKNNLPTLSQGEMAYTTDEKSTYIGDGSQNVRLLDQKDKMEITSQLAEISKQEILADIDQTEYKAGGKFDTSYLQSQQAIHYARFLQKLRMKQGVKITCMGTSITIGHDTISPDKRSVTGDIGVTTIAGKTYPEQLSDVLNEIYQDTVTIENHGYSGDTVFSAFTRWNKKHDSDLSILEYGANDSTQNLDIQEFIKVYEQFIIRELIWGNPVVVILPSKFKNAEAINRDTFSNAVYTLAGKYNLPLIDTELLLKNYDSSIYSDTVHLNTLGYSILGTKIASIFVGEGPSKPRVVSPGHKLLSRPSIDNIIFGNYSSKSVSYLAGMTPNETDSSGKGITALLNPPAENRSMVYYSFYASTDDMVIVPHMYISANAKVTISLDWGLKEPQNSIDSSLGIAPIVEDSIGKYVIDNMGKATDLPIDKTNYMEKISKPIHIKTEGWHLLRIESYNASSTLYGIEFIDYLDMNRQTSSSGKPPFVFQVGSDNIATVNETRFKYNDFASKLNYSFDGNDYWKNPALRITLNAPLHAVDSYVFILGAKGTPQSGTKLMGDRSRFLANQDVDISQMRTLTSVHYDFSTDEIVFTWGTNISRRVTCTISII